MREIARIEYINGPSCILLVPKEDILQRESALSVYDGNTVSLFSDRDPEYSVVLPPGEGAKDWTSVERIINRALAVSLGRDSIIAGIGGGVVTDVTALAASLYMRGCRLILIPTTLLAMADAAIGGKTGIDFAGHKNLVGTFYPADEVRICPRLLQTLPENEYRSGLSEVIKHSILAPGEPGGFWDMLINKKQMILARDESILEEIIIAAIKVKTDIVSSDIQDKGQRAFLNLGHTFAHALESATNFSRWSHGEAVGWGMLKALELGERLSITDKRWADECRKMISEYDLDMLTPQVLPEEIKAAMVSDKKKRAGRLRFVLIREPGSPILQEVPEEDIDAVLGI